MSSPRDTQLTLAPEYTYRREGFGGLLFDHDSKQTRFYNHAAALTIESLFDAGSPDFDDFARDHADPAFLGALRAERIAVPRAHVSEPGRGFFRDVFEFQADHLHAPLAVELELTLKCMRRCSYCAYDARPDREVDQDLSRESYRRIFAKLERAGVLYLRFTGGDPLARPDSLDILEDADQWRFGLALASDLTVFSEQTACRLGGMRNLVALQTTLDGPTPEIADELRGHGNFRKVTHAIDRLVAHGVPLIVGTIVHKRNVSHVYQIAKLLSRWPVKWCVSPLYNAGRGRELEALVPDDHDLILAYEQFARAVAEGLVEPADPAWQRIAAPLPSAARAGLWHSLPWLVRSPDRVLRVDPRGRCYTSIHLKEVLDDQVYVGDIVGDDLIELWNHAPLLEQLRGRRESSTYFGDVFDIRRVSKTAPATTTQATGTT